MIASGSQDLELTWRPVHQGDAAALFMLWQRIEEHDDPPYRSTREELDESFVTQWTDLTENSIAGFDSTGRLCAFGLVSVPPDDAGPVRVFLDGGVCPDHRHRGVGSAILEWQIERARGVLTETGNGSGTIVVHVEDGMDHSADLVRRYGFSEAGYHTEMRRDLALELPEVAVLRPLSVEPWTMELDDQIRLAHNEAFGSHAQAQSATVWTEGRTYFVPEWSFLVLDRTTDRAQVAGYLLASKYEQDWETLGWSEGYVDMLGVRAPWRGRRIATTLLVRAMRAFAESGMEYAALGVDHATRQDSLGLFDKLGFEPTRGSTTYTIEV
ncbi:GNAT family N-acetyltransferase [Ruania alba]|uniref:Acetyltransferase (GNAT) family protein n=1 Tax=Ruania alba TaxID=648782 RepID=A0A1H5FIR5_9MICO|nr:GNAT family N-acetyltransferase [Ruania alba]SEE03320.1 Acetyltransferase (GNAT) family protein [Ruania alba]